MTLHFCQRLDAATQYVQIIFRVGELFELLLAPRLDKLSELTELANHVREAGYLVLCWFHYWVFSTKKV